MLPLTFLPNVDDAIMFEGRLFGYLSTMKHLLLVRHAKSSWNNSSLTDFDRPLNDRGLHDAPMMARRLLAKKISIDQLVSSTANRALTTATLFAKELGIKQGNVVKLPILYHASPDTFEEVISGLSDEHDTIAIFSHNPGITAYVNQLKVAMVDNMPTCGIFGVHAITNNWKDFAGAEKRFWLFDYPKNF